MSKAARVSSILMERAAKFVARQAQKHVPYGFENPFLRIPFGPVEAEATAVDLRVTGAIPSGLDGLYARIGANPMDVPNPANYHWFLGDGMVHGVRLLEGRAMWYRNRWIGSDTVNERLGRQRAPGLRHRMVDTVNTNVIGHAGGIWALVEAGALPVELSDTLETKRHGFFNTSLRRAFSAHPHRDPATGELHAICYDVLVYDHVFYVVIGTDGGLIRDVAIPVRHGPMIHDCAMTATRMVILDLPITFSLGAALRGVTFPYQWNTRHAARIGLLPRDGSAADTVWFEAPPFFAFHTANAYDRPDGSVVLDMITYPHMFDRTRQGPEPDSVSTFERWTLGPAKGVFTRETLSDFRQEFPRCDDRRTGQAYRYAYTVGIDLRQTGPQKLHAHDLQTGRILRHDFGPTHMPAETIFVPRHGQADENDGYLLTYVYDLRENSSTLTILNAGDVEGEPAATIHLPAPVPLGFHGNWIPDQVSPQSVFRPY
jgi:carotenoid cleavage dioxygenase